MGKKRQGYDVTDYFRDNPTASLNDLINNVDSFHPPDAPGEKSPIKRVWTWDEITVHGAEIYTHPEPVSSEQETTSDKLTKINGRSPELETATVHHMRPLTDLGNAERFVDQRGDDFRYTYNLGWFAWDGTRWVRDDGDLLFMEAAAGVVRKIGDEDAINDNHAKALEKHARRSEGAGKLAAIERLARSKLAARLTDFDQNKLLINFTNGTFNLKTNDIREHRRGDMITQIACSDYSPGADRTTWEKFIREILPKQGLHDYVQDAVGYSLTGSVKEQCMFILYGTGSNGKSTFTDTIIRAFGDYGKAVPSKLMMSGASDQHPTLLTELQWRRFASAQETKEGGRLDEAMIKMISGGDVITARRMKKDFFDFDPTHKLWLSTNHKPTIRGADIGIWRRMRLIPFTVSIPDERKDHDLMDKLQNEFPGILAWAMIGAMRWAARGLQMTDEIRQATEEYRAEQDTIGQWLDERVSSIEGNMVSKKTVYDDYRNWCEENGLYSMTQRSLTDRLKERGYTEGRTASSRVWNGISLIRVADDSDDQPLFNYADKPY